MLIFSKEFSEFNRYTCRKVFAILAVQLIVTTIIATATLEKHGLPPIMDSYRAAELILEATFARLHYHIICMFYLRQLRTCQAFAHVDQRNPPASLMILRKQEWQQRKLARWCIAFKEHCCHWGHVFWTEMSSTDGRPTSGCKFFQENVIVVWGRFGKHSVFRPKSHRPRILQTLALAASVGTMLSLCCCPKLSCNSLHLGCQCESNIWLMIVYICWHLDT